MMIILPNQFISACEIETSSPDQSVPDGIYVTSGATIVGEVNTAVAESETSIYVSSGTTVVGENNISNSKINNNVSNVGSALKSSNDKNNVLGLSKSFTAQPEVKDKSLKSHQEKSIQKVEITFYSSLPKIPTTTLEKSSFSLGIVSSNTLSFSFGTIQITKKSEIASFILRIKRQAFNTSFIFLEDSKNRKIYLRGPPLFEFFV